MNGRRSGGVSLRRGVLLLGALLSLLAWSSARGAAFSIERIPPSALPSAAGNGASGGGSLSDDGRLLAFYSVATNLGPGGFSGGSIFVRDLPGKTTSFVNVNNEGTACSAQPSPPAISGDGRYVAFLSGDPQLGGSNGSIHVFLHDRFAGTTEQIDLANDGQPRVGNAREGLAVSFDGRYVAFTTNASLAAGGNQAGGVYVRDRIGGVTERISVPSNGAPLNGSGGEQARMSSDGRYVAFRSRVTNLVPGDTNDTLDIFVRDRVSGTTERVSVAGNGVQAERDCDDPAISADGRFVSFSSQAAALTGVVDGWQQVFLRDRQAGTTECISLNRFGEVSGGHSEKSSISSGGRFVAFVSFGDDLVAGDTNETTDCFVRDRLTGSTTRVSVSSEGAEAEGLGAPFSPEVMLTPSGRHVAFSSVARNLTPDGQYGNFPDVFVHDRATATTLLGTPAVESTEPIGTVRGPALSGNGRFVAFKSTASNLVAGDRDEGLDTFLYDRQAGFTSMVSLLNDNSQFRTSQPDTPAVTPDGRYVAFTAEPRDDPEVFVSQHVYVRDRQTGNTDLVSVPIGGAPLIGDCFGVSISTDGRYVAFLSHAGNLVPGDGIPDIDVYVFDRTSRTTERITVTPSGADSAGSALAARISGDGRWVVFSSFATDLVPGDTNGYTDIFVRDRLSGTTERVSVSTAGGQADSECRAPCISADGRYVAFISFASNLGGDVVEWSGVYVRDRLLGTTVKISDPIDGVPHAAYNEETTAISGSGRYVAFSSASDGLVPGDTNGVEDVFVRDLVAGATARVSVSGTGAEANGTSVSAAISSDGRVVAFASGATNLWPGDSGFSQDTFVATNPLWDTTPTGSADSYSAVDAKPLIVAGPGVLANDDDPSGTGLTATLATPPSHGTLSLQANGGFTYTSTSGYTGPDAFTYRATNGRTTPPVTVSITVLPAPPTISDVANRSTFEDTPTSAIPFTVGDAETPASSLTVSGASSNTTLVPNNRLSFSGSGANRTVTITPASNQSGNTTITLTVSDGTATASDTFLLTVTPVNDPPAAQNDDYSVAEDGTLTIAAPGVLANDTDVEGNALTAAKLTGPAHGALSFSANGAFTYQPVADYRGPDSFTYRTNDGQSDSGAALVNLTVTSVNDPPSAAAQAVTTPEDTPRAITLAGTDVDGEPLTYTIVSTPSHGTLSGSGAARTYTPAANYYGADNFTYRVSDGALTSAQAMVTITVDAVNDPPTTTADTYTVNKNLTLQVPAPGVLGNDQDVEGDPFTAELAQAPLHGTLSLTPAGAFVYTPAPGFEGGDLFKYRATDGITASQAVAVNLTVTGVNNPPVATSVALDVDEDTTKSFQLPASDPDGATLTYLILAQPAHGKLTGMGASRTYQPNANYSGADTLVFQATDGQAVSERATVTFNVRPVNDPPTAEAGPDRTVNATAPNTPVTLNGSGADVEAEPLAYAWSLDGTVLATTAQATVNLPTGVHHLLLTVTDAGGASATDMVAITVQDTTAPQVTCPGDLTLSASLATGAVVTYTVTAMDAVSPATVTCNPPSGSTIPEGVTMVTCTAEDAAGNRASCTFRVTVTPPASTVGKVSANGAIPVTGGSGKLKVSVSYKAGHPIKGSVSFTDPVTRKAIKSSSLTALVISGTRARIFGTTRLSSGATARFLAEADDLGTTPGVDRFRLELSDGRVFGAANLSKGSVSITR